ncbi:MAG: DUF2784 domain-containing protein [Chloroflexi bacterium]|nr:DUF2784 domain-containing protein [Chloroflexota bacterium]
MLKKTYKIAADLVLVAHFAFAATSVFGGFGVLFSRGWALIHLPTVIWSSAINLVGWTCPLTPVEKRFREAAGGVSYQGGFIQHYIGQLVYPKAMPRKLELTAGVSVLVWNALVYAGVWLWLSRGAKRRMAEIRSAGKVS